MDAGHPGNEDLRSCRQGGNDSPVFMFPQLSNGQSVVAAAAPALASTRRACQLMESFKETKRDVKEPQRLVVVLALLRRLQKVQPDHLYIVQQLALADLQIQASRHGHNLAENVRAINAGRWT